MNPDDLRQQVELQIVEMIKKKLAEGTMTEERSQAIAQHVLNELKLGMTFEELHKALFNLDDQFIELAPVTLPFIRDYEKNVTQQARMKVQELISQGKYEEAEELGKQAITGDVKVVWQASAKPPAHS
jgi:polyhydroxyalkanoate synthesis regulator phasin